MIKIITIIFYLFMLHLPVHAQRMPSRWIHFNPMAGDKHQFNDKQRIWFNQFSGWAAFGKYIASNDNEHAWFQNLGGYLELVRFARTSNLVFLTHIEFISNDKNDIRFNPRSIFWEEGFLYTRAFEHSYLQLGYFHRCKHDIDNYTIEQERTLIYGSVQGNYIFNFYTQPNFGAIRLVLKNDVYTICKDYRLPVRYESSGGSYEQLLGSSNFHIDYQNKIFNRRLGLYSQIFTQITLFGKNTGFFSRFQRVKNGYFDYGLSIGALLGEKEMVRLGFFYEKMSDSGITVVPRKANILGFSLTAVSPLDVW